MAHPGGRPTKYNKTIFSETQKYLDSCVDKSYTVVRSQSERTKSVENRLRVKLPTIEGLAFHLHINKTTIHEWRRAHPEFSNLIDELLALQVDRLVNQGLSGDYNATIAKVLLTKHGYREGQEVASEIRYLPNDEERAESLAALRSVL